MKNFYAVVTDRNYIARVLCLYRSLEPWLHDREFGFFCVDEGAASLLERLHLPKAVVVRYEEFAFSALDAVKPTRKLNEFCWTCKPAALQYAMRTWPELEWAVYLDGDMMGFNNPNLAFEGIDGSILLTPHRYSPAFAHHADTAGMHNGGYAAFRNLPEGRAALDWWSERCIELCPAVRIGNVYADQTYLDHMPGLFPGTIASAHKGLNAAPWNIENYAVSHKNGTVYCDENPLLIYHFQAMKQYGARLYDMYGGDYDLPKNAVRYIYHPHLEALTSALSAVRAVDPRYRGGLLPLMQDPRSIYHQIRRAFSGTNNLSMVLK